VKVPRDKFEEKTIIEKISPDPSLLKRGTYALPLFKKGDVGGLLMNIFIILFA
jgi:hypothetical protein